MKGQGRHNKMLNMEEKITLSKLLDAEPNCLTKSERNAISKALYAIQDHSQQIYWKEDMSLKCPHCGHVYDTVAYLNITECDNKCYECGGKYDVRDLSKGVLRDERR